MAAAVAPVPPVTLLALSTEIAILPVVLPSLWARTPLDPAPCAATWPLVRPR
jgi:hypothetical protein